MQLILITPPLHHPQEIDILTAAVQMGIHRIHIRKPNMDTAALHNYCKLLSADILRISSLHYYKDIMPKYAFSGFHFSDSQRKEAWYQKNILPSPKLLSSSFHQITDIPTEEKHLHYAFCSPVYPSISKQGHQPTFDWNVREMETDIQLFALGGVNTSKIWDCKQRGFVGVAILGTVWQHPNARAAIQALEEIKEQCDQLQ